MSVDIPDDRLVMDAARLELAEAGLSEYQLSWRTQNVPMTVGSIDASMKVGKALHDQNKRQTVRSSSPARAPIPAPSSRCYCLPLRSGATTSAHHRSR